MVNEIELDGNHIRVFSNYNYYIIADADAECRMSHEEKQERVRWCRENLELKYYRNEYGYANIKSWCHASMVNKAGFRPYWVFYFRFKEDAAFFKLTWL